MQFLVPYVCTGVYAVRVCVGVYMRGWVCVMCMSVYHVENKCSSVFGRCQRSSECPGGNSESFLNKIYLVRKLGQSLYLEYLCIMVRRRF